MKYIVLLIYLNPVFSFSQNNSFEVNFIHNYNQYVDPNSVTDTAKYLRVIQTNKAWNNQGINVKKNHTYYFSSIGDSYSIDESGNKIYLSGPKSTLSKVPDFEKDSQFIKFHLRLINVSFQSERFRLQEKSDTLIIIREHTSPSNYRDRWFDRKTKNQFRIDNVHINDSNEEIIRTTKFFGFRRLENGLLVPSRATYTSNFAEGEIDYKQFIFGPF